MLRSFRLRALAGACFCLASLGLGACGSPAPPNPGSASSLPAGSSATGPGSTSSLSAGRTPAGPSSAGSSSARSSPPRLASPGPAVSPSRKPPAGSPASAVFAGYDWLVIAISHDGKTTSIPAQLNVNLRFAWSGRFAADDSVNSYSGTFLITPGGFTTSGIAGTLIGYAGHDPAVLMSQSMMIAFGNGGAAAARVTGDQLVIKVGSYTITSQRHGPAGALS